MPGNLASKIVSPGGVLPEDAPVSDLIQKGGGSWNSSLVGTLFYPFGGLEDFTSSIMYDCAGGYANVAKRKIGTLLCQNGVSSSQWVGW